MKTRRGELTGECCMSRGDETQTFFVANHPKSFQLEPPHVVSYKSMGADGRRNFRWLIDLAVANRCSPFPKRQNFHRMMSRFARCHRPNHICDATFHREPAGQSVRESPPCWDNLVHSGDSILLQYFCIQSPECLGANLCCCRSPLPIGINYHWWDIDCRGLPHKSAYQAQDTLLHLLQHFRWL